MDFIILRSAKLLRVLDANLRVLSESVPATCRNRFVRGSHALCGAPLRPSATQSIPEPYDPLIIACASTNKKAQNRTIGSVRAHMPQSSISALGVLPNRASTSHCGPIAPQLATCATLPRIYSGCREGPPYKDDYIAAGVIGQQFCVPALCKNPLASSAGPFLEVGGPFYRGVAGRARPENCQDCSLP